MRRLLRWALLAKGLAVALLVTGCAFVRNIPAESTPLRNARYYRGQDLPNLALGVGCDAAVGLVVRGRSVAAVLGRFGTCAAGAVIQRQTDRGYRESGGLFILSGAWLFELGRIVAGGR